jgi:hypothetical protein
VTDLLTNDNGQQPRYAKESLPLLSMIVIICKSIYLNTIRTSLIGPFDKNYNGLVLLLFRGGITDSREFIGHDGKTESNCLLHPILHGV